MRLVCGKQPQPVAALRRARSGARARMPRAAAVRAQCESESKHRQHRQHHGKIGDAEGLGVAAAKVGNGADDGRGKHSRPRRGQRREARGLGLYRLHRERSHRGGAAAPPRTARAHPGARRVLRARSAATAVATGGVSPVTRYSLLRSVGCANASPRHQREHTPAQVFTGVSGVALGFRGQFGSNIFRELVVGIGFKPSAHGEPFGRLCICPSRLGQPEPFQRRRSQDGRKTREVLEA